MLNNFFDKNADKFYFVFRVIVGLLFFLHGWMKVPGVLDGTNPIGSLMFFAAIIEVIGGILIILGLFTRWVAVIAALEMIVAYFKAHAPAALSPLANRGEPAVLFFAAFLVLAAYGAKKWAIDNAIQR